MAVIVSGKFSIYAFDFEQNLLMYFIEALLKDARWFQAVVFLKTGKSVNTFNGEILISFILLNIFHFILYGWWYLY